MSSWVWFVVVLVVVAAAVTLGRLLARGARGHARIVRDHYRDEPTPLGQCARGRCRRAATTASGYCSTKHELDDEYNDAGY